MWAALVVLSLSFDACAVPKGELLHGPQQHDNYGEWLHNVTKWRAACLLQLQYNSSEYHIYSEPSLQWTQTAFIQPQMHPYDRYFFDDGAYTVSRWLSDLQHRYGGIDAALVWPTYPNIGADDRSQFDLIEALPGGVASIQKFVAELKSKGVKVLLPLNPWDHATRPDPQNRTMAQQLVDLIEATGADGFNGDTMPEIPADYYNQSILRHAHPIAMEPEGGGRPETMEWDSMGWGYWDYSTRVPGVDYMKWLDPRRLTNVCDRWNKNKTNNLQFAFFNGDGYETWENVWSAWNGIVPQDAEAIRRIAHVLRFFGGYNYTHGGGGGGDLYENWLPHAPMLQNHTVFASRWKIQAQVQVQLGVERKKQRQQEEQEQEQEEQAMLLHLPSFLWTIVNRGSVPTRGPQMAALTDHTAAPLPPPLGNYTVAYDYRYYDCYHGVELTPTPGAAPAGGATLEFDVEGSGYGCVLALPVDPVVSAGVVHAAEVAAHDSVIMREIIPPVALSQFLDEMRTMTALPLSSYSKKWTYLEQEMVKEPVTTAASTATATTTAIATVTATRGGGSAVLIPGGVYRFESLGTGYTDGNAINDGVGVQFPWEQRPTRKHGQFMTMPSFLMDRHPVTCAQYQQFLRETSYVPSDMHNFLRNWQAGGNSNSSSAVPSTWQYPAGYANKPVTYVSLKEARAYCRHVQKRLPQEYEWTYAAQGGNPYNTYPWGPDADASRYPPTQQGRTIPGPADVDAFGAVGASAFGVEDLVGNVWQYTSEFRDEHSRGVVVKGSSNYFIGNFSYWYFKQALRLAQHNKYLLMDDAYERAGTIGFRCVADVNASDSTSTGTGTGSSETVRVATNGLNSEVRMDCVGVAAGATGPEVLCAVLATPSAFINLSEGSADWTHYGTNPSAQEQEQDQNRLLTNRKARATYDPANQTAGIGPLRWGAQCLSPVNFGGNAQAYSWSDGSTALANQTARTANTSSGVYSVCPKGQGFSLDVPPVASQGQAQEALAVLTVDVGQYFSRATFTATTTPATAATLGQAFSYSQVLESDPTTNQVVKDFQYTTQFRVQFQKAAGVRVQWMNTPVGTDSDEEGAGNISIQSATLAICDDI